MIGRHSIKASHQVFIDSYAYRLCSSEERQRIAASNPRLVLEPASSVQPKIPIPDTALDVGTFSLRVMALVAAVLGGGPGVVLGMMLMALDEWTKPK